MLLLIRHIDYAFCQTGTQQSPIQLLLSQGLSVNHRPCFDYPESVSGKFYNWGYGPAFALDHPEGSYTGLPKLKFDDETYYLSGWHTHAPAEHIVQGERSKAELHMVHVDDSGRPQAVVGIRIDPGNKASAFFSQLPPLIRWNETELHVETETDPRLALSEVHFSEFWTYRGSLTTPPCTEGLRWFVARDVLFTNVEQVQNLLGASTYSSRVEQEVWLHQINV